MRNADYKLDYMLDPPDDPEDYYEVDDDCDIDCYDKQAEEEADYYYELHRWSYKSKDVLHGFWRLLKLKY